MVGLTTFGDWLKNIVDLTQKDFPLPPRIQIIPRLATTDEQ
jgi:hypothetical protein